jgi:holo-[acyl-carrier protein] synthase
LSIHCGVDIIEIERIKHTIESNGASFIARVFTKSEDDYCKSKNVVKYKSYAARFAAKEAVVKALGTGFHKGIEWKDIEICIGELGNPYAVLSGKAKEQFDEIKGRDISLSLSHCDNYAVAYAVIQSES